MPSIKGFAVLKVFYWVLVDFALNRTLFLIFKKFIEFIYFSNIQFIIFLKVSKIAPQGWKDAKMVPNSGNRILGESVTLYQRLKYLPEDINTTFKDPANKHQFYLQLRQDILLGKYPMNQSQHLSLAGMALQVEFGDFSQDVHDDVYFDLEHYLPEHCIKDDCQAIRASLIKLHKAHLGQSQSKTELTFCNELLRHENYGFHMFKVWIDKKLQRSKVSAITVLIIYTCQKQLFLSKSPNFHENNKMFLF